MISSWETENKRRWEGFCEGENELGEIGPAIKVNVQDDPESRPFRMSPQDE